MNKQTWQERAMKSPTYDKSLSPRERLKDFMGKYYVNLNGVTPNNNHEITYPHKIEILDMVDLIISEEIEKAEERGRIKGIEESRKATVSYRVCTGRDNFKYADEVLQALIENKS